MMKTAPLGTKKILLKSLALEFYRIHAGFFLVLLFFATGFLQLPEHYFLMEAAVGSWFIFCLFAATWLLYWVFCIRFTWLALKKKKTAFFTTFACFR